MSLFKKILLYGGIVAMNLGIGCQTPKSYVPPPNQPNLQQQIQDYENNINNKIAEMDDKIKDLYDNIQKENKKEGVKSSYDNDASKLTEESIDDMINMTYKVGVEMKYKKMTTGELVNLKGIGTGFLVDYKDDKQYFITCSHVTKAEKTILDSNNNLYELVESKTYLIDNKGKKYDVDVLRENDDVDIAVLKTKKDLGIKPKIKFADKPLKRGDIIYAVGHPLNIGKFLSQGIITNIPDKEKFFYESAALNPGMSGGPLFVLLDGKPFIAGVNEFVVSNRNPFGTPVQGIFGAVHYKHAKKELEKILKDETKLLEKEEDF